MQKRLSLFLLTLFTYFLSTTSLYSANREILTSACIDNEKQLDSTLWGKDEAQCRKECQNFKKHINNIAQKHLASSYQDLDRGQKIIDAALKLSFHKVTYAYLQMHKDLKETTLLEEQTIKDTYKSLGHEQREQLMVFYQQIAPLYRQKRFMFENLERLNLLKDVLIRVSKRQKDNRFHLSYSDFVALDSYYYSGKEENLSKQSYLSKLLGELSHTYRYRKFNDDIPHLQKKLAQAQKELNQLKKKFNLKEINMRQLKKERQQAVKDIANFAQRMHRVENFCNHLLGTQTQFNIICYNKHKVPQVIQTENITSLLKALQSNYHITAAPLKIIQACVDPHAPAGKNVKLELRNLPSDKRWSVEWNNHSQLLTNNNLDNISTHYIAAQAGDKIILKNKNGKKLSTVVHKKCQQNGSKPQTKDKLALYLNVKKEPNNLSNIVEFAVHKNLRRLQKGYKVHCALNAKKITVTPQRVDIPVSKKDQTLICYATAGTLRSTDVKKFFSGEKKKPVPKIALNIKLEQLEIIPPTKKEESDSTESDDPKNKSTTKETKKEKKVNKTTEQTGPSEEGKQDVGLFKFKATVSSTLKDPQWKKDPDKIYSVNCKPAAVKMEKDGKAPHTLIFTYQNIAENVTCNATPTTAYKDKLSEASATIVIPGIDNYDDEEIIEDDAKEESKVDLKPPVEKKPTAQDGKAKFHPAPPPQFIKLPPKMPYILPGMP